MVAVAAACVRGEPDSSLRPGDTVWGPRKARILDLSVDSSRIWPGARTPGAFNVVWSAQTTLAARTQLAHSEPSLSRE